MFHGAPFDFSSINVIIIGSRFSLEKITVCFVPELSGTAGKALKVLKAKQKGRRYPVPILASLMISPCFLIGAASAANGDFSGKESRFS